MECLLKNPRVFLKFGKSWSISNIEELNIRLMDVGWDLSGGKSRNVWGTVVVPEELISYAQEYVKVNNKRPSIWTCYDDLLYTKDENGNWHVTPENLPKSISATFKCSRNRFSPIVENMSMRIAVALNLPTSYNFLVKFTPELHKKISSHITPPGVSKEVLNNYGVVSIDMLKGYRTTIETAQEGVGQTSANGDQLISFYDSKRIVRSQFSSFPTDDGLVKNWMKCVRAFSTSYLDGKTEEERERRLANINSRIARSTLLRTFIGDCDFTAFNSGYIYNSRKRELVYAPNFDYGEAFTALRDAKLERYHFSKENLKFILKHQPNYLEMKKHEQSKSIKEIAQTYESNTSEENLKFISTHFEDDIVEFMLSLNQAIEDNIISDIIYSYAQKNEHGDQLITYEEAKIFDEYITERANWISFIIIKNIMESEPTIFLDKAFKNKIGKHASTFPVEKLKTFVDKKFDSLNDEEKNKIHNFQSYSEKAYYIKENFPEEFGFFTKKINSIIDNFWRKSLSENFKEYFSMEKESPVLSKDAVKNLFIKQFIDKTFEYSYKANTAPFQHHKEQNKDKA